MRTPRHTRTTRQVDDQLAYLEYFNELEDKLLFSQSFSAGQTNCLRNSVAVKALHTYTYAQSRALKLRTKRTY